MKTLAIISCLIAVCAATGHVIQPYYVAPTTLYRTPALDSSYVESSRVGGNFAYRTVEGHAYQAVTPLAYSYYPVTYPFLASHPYVPYQPAFIEQPFAFKPIAPIAPAPAAVETPAVATEQKDLTDGRQIDEDTVAVESSWMELDSNKSGINDC